jgi:hypothetical protein
MEPPAQHIVTQDIGAGQPAQVEWPQVALAGFVRFEAGCLPLLADPVRRT